MSMLGAYTLIFEEQGLCRTEPNLTRKEIHDFSEPVWFYDENTWHNYVFDLDKKKLRGVIHCGAHNCPETGCYVPLFGENVIWIEANKNSYDEWAKVCAKHHNQKAYNVAVSDYDGVGDIIIDGSPDTGSLLNTRGISQRVAIYKLDTLIEHHGLDINNYNFLNIDTEGSELNVLKGAEKTLEHIDYIFMEVSTAARFSGGPTFAELNQYVIDRGFEFVKVSDSINTIGWGDAFYKRKS